MKRITILVPDGQNNLSSIAGTYKILSRANRYWQENKNQEGYLIELAGISRQVDFHDGLFSARPHVQISDVAKSDLIIIPSLSHNYDRAIDENGQIIDWIKVQYACGAEIASICTGAFLLASAGLLDGRVCSTHWAFTEMFRRMFPAVDLQADLLITDKNGIYTNGGAFSFLNLVIYLVEKYFDRETAIFCAKIFQIEIDRHSQSPFIIFTGQKMHDDQIIKDAQLLMEDNLQEKLLIDDLVSRFALSRRSFDRRFIKATGNRPLEYRQRVRIEAAKKFLETSGKSIKEVMFETGYSDVKAFREIFRKITGMSPFDYR